MKAIVRFALVLLMVNFVAASILAGIYYVTKPVIDKQQELIEAQALKQVMPESAGDKVELVEDRGLKYWKVFDGDKGRIAGYIFIAKKYGYSSEIETMVGIKKDGTITGARVLNQNETPGLGAKIVEVVSDRTVLTAIKNIFSKNKEYTLIAEPHFTGQFKGLDVKALSLSTKGVDAITGATISSKACVESIREQGLKILNR